MIQYRKSIILPLLKRRQADSRLQFAVMSWQFFV